LEAAAFAVLEAKKRMSNVEQEVPQPIGIDVGTSRIVVARHADRKYAYEAQLNAFITLPYSRLAESLLTRENVFHEVYGNEIVVAGNDADRFAEVFHAETRRPMVNGLLNPKEPHGVAVIRMIIAKLLGKAVSDKQKAVFSVPAKGIAGDNGLPYHEASIRQILGELGYQPQPIEEGLAVVFGELGASNYTGVGVSCGSGLCNICLAVLSVPVISFSVGKAGDFIDSSAAMVTGEVATRMRIQKEQSFRLNGLSGDLSHNAITVYYEEMINSLTEAMRKEFSSAARMPKLDQGVPLVLSGGTAMPKGFLEQFVKCLNAAEFPVRLSDVHVSPDPLNSTARGALMAALC
jgi:hypothetical protein